MSTPNPQAIIIRPLATLEEYMAIDQVQKEAWRMADMEVMPGHLFHALASHGASILGAFDNGRLVGFAAAVLGLIELGGRVDAVAAARLKLYSAIAGVLPEYQSHGVGYRLKLAQRDYAIRLGIHMISWTYDPLETRNARLNIGKLGAICRTYWPNYHGDMGGINIGLETDRFHVEWWVMRNRARGRVDEQRSPLSLPALLGGGAVLLNEATVDDNGRLLPAANPRPTGGNLLLVEIPADFQTIRHTDNALARQWRAHTRAIFVNLFDQGYVVTDFVNHTDDTNTPRSYYLLTADQA